MKTFLRRILAPLATALALLAAPVAFGAPPLNVTITAPAAGSLGTLSSPNNAVTLTATATASGGGAFITQIDFRVNGTSVGVATTSPFSVTWTPTAPGTFALTAIATDSSAASNNTLTSGTVTVTVAAVRLASISTPATNATVTQNSVLFMRASASMSDGVVRDVEFFLGGTSLGTAVTSAPYFLTPTITTAPGTYNLVARATSSDGATTWDSTATYPITVVAQPGTAPTVTFVAPAITDVIAVGNPVTVSATATDTDGFIPTSAPGGVAFYADGELIGTDFTAPYSLTWTPTLAKSVTLLAIGTDDKGNTRSATRNVTVSASAVPTVSVTAPTTGSVVTVGSNVTVSANATGAGGAAVAQVQFLVGTTIIGTDTTSPYSVVWVPSTAGNFSITARVIDVNNATVTSSAVTVTATTATSVAITAPANNATATVGTATTVTASPSASLGNTVTSVTFFAGATQIGAAVTAAPYTVAWTPTTAGAVSLTATVLDSAGVSATSPAVAVTVANSLPTISLTAPVAGGLVTIGSNVALSATATAGSVGTIAQVQFLVGTTIVGADTTAPYSVTWVPSSAGSFSITARVIDSLGNTVTSSAVTVTATSATSVTLTAPANNSTATVGTATTVTASPSASLGNTVTSVTFFAGATQIGAAVTAAPYTVAWTPTTAGAVSLTATVLDSAGVSATSPAVAVTVANSLPTISLTAPVSGGLVTIGSNVALSATATAGSGGATIAQVQFLVGATIVGADSAAPYSVTWVPSSAGSFSITARAIDSLGNTVTSSAVTVTATSATSVTLTAPANNSTATVGTATTVTASPSASLGNSVTSVTFFAGATPIGAAVTAAPYTVAWTPTTAGAVSLTAVVLDSAGVSATSAAIAVTVANSLPTITLTAPVSGGLVTIGSNVALSATATAGSGGAIAQVQFLVGTTIV
ncbi:MAG: hypothetical protein EXS37_16575, partial [Opitutus sp.]|nr:hypothetical protein [Opitutus sp.]